MSVEEDEDNTEVVEEVQQLAAETVQPDHTEVPIKSSPPPVAGATVSTDPTAYDGLDPRYHSFLESVKQRDTWSGGELRSLQISVA